MSKEEFIDELYSKLKVLNETIWENRILKPKIDKWLDNFIEQEEKLHALYLLSEFMYFGSVQMRNLLKSLYRDLYRYPIIDSIRKANSNTLDKGIIETSYKEKEKLTRFFGVGNPSESGAHLLYFFRQENYLSKKLFINTDEIFDRTDSSNLKLMDLDLEYYIFIDDFCGTGSQVKRSKPLINIINDIRRLKPNVIINYLMLVGTTHGIENVKKTRLFDFVDAVIKLDDSFKSFESNSRYFKDATLPVNITKAKDISKKYGLPLIKDICLKDGVKASLIDYFAEQHVLGFNDCQLLIGFHHNTPDNTLPIIWYDEEDIPWTPIFKRYNKKYEF